MFQFFVTPDIAYVVLMLAILLIIMALLAPGTGLLELLALVFFLAAGYQMLQVPLNLWALIVIAAGVVPLYLAVRQRGQRLFLGLAVALFFSGSALLFRSLDGRIFGVHFLLVAAVTVLEGGFIWFMMEKTIETFFKPPVHDLSTLIGQVGEARTDIAQEGSVYVSGELWSAHSQTAIRQGNLVKVIARDGFCLIVEAIQNDTNA
ncbi:MAG: hypothetical protein Fur0018_16900 [Anaerolineales bacterium]